MINTANLGEGILVAIVGFVIVITVLLIITFVLSMFKYIFKTEQQTEGKPADLVLPPAEQEKPLPEVKDETDDSELVAVITAAIAASTQSSTDRLVVRSIRRTTGWNSETIRERNIG